MPATYVDQIFGNPNVVAYQANSPIQQQLQNNYALEQIHIRLTGTLTNASYTTAPTKYVEALENLLGLFSLSATGKSTGATTDQLTAVDAAFLRFKTRIMEGTDCTRVDVGTANAAYNFETNVKKYFVDPRSNKSRLTTLFTDLLSSLTAVYGFRDQTAMVYGGVAGTSTLSNVQLTVQGRMWLGLPYISPSPYVKETQRTVAVNASQNAMRFDRVPTGNILRRQYFKGMVGPTNFADPSDVIFGATNQASGPLVKLLINNATTKLNAVYGQLRNDNKMLFNQESMPSGYCVYEPARDKQIANSVSLVNVPNADNYIDVNYTSGSTNTIQITDEQIINVSVAQLTQ